MSFLEKQDLNIQSRISWLVGFLLTCIAMLYVLPKQAYVGKSDSIETQERVFYIAPMPELKQRILPPQLNPFEKKTQDVNMRLTLKPRQNFASLLRGYGVSSVNIAALTKSLSAKIDLDSLRVGTEFSFKMGHNKNFNAISVQDVSHDLKEMIFKSGAGTVLTASLTENDTYQIRESYLPVKKIPLLKTGQVIGSFYLSAQRAGVPVRMISNAIKSLGYNVDLRELQKGDLFEFAYDEYRDDEGKIIGTSALKYVSLTVARKKHEHYYLTDTKGNAKPYNASGQNAGRAFLMRTPIDGARMSSGFGYRRHPVLGFTKMHTGVDFAAPTGTPIYAAGDGVLAQQYRSGSYGNYIKIQHNGTYATAYAHMSRFARGNRVGTRVRQGQVIGYVGTTGRSTGPHLHYEVIKNGVQINPATVNVAIAPVTPPQEKIAYDALKREITARRAGRLQVVTYKSIKDVKEKIL